LRRLAERGVDPRPGSIDGVEGPKDDVKKPMHKHGLVDPMPARGEQGP
jgi:hypothetical protein